MPTVQKFDHTMIEKYLKNRELKYLRDSEGDYRVDFAYDEDTGCEMTVWLIASGRNHEIYSVLVLSDKAIPKSDWGKAAMLCNTWNKERRWPKAYLFVRDPATDMRGEIRLEQQIDLEQGIHQELFNDFTNTMILGSFLFWEWAHKEQGL